MQNRGETLKACGNNRRIGEIENARFEAQLLRQRPDAFSMAAGENRTEIVILRKARGEPAGVAVRAVEHPLSAHSFLSGPNDGIAL